MSSRHAERFAGTRVRRRVIIGAIHVLVALAATVALAKDTVRDVGGSEKQRARVQKQIDRIPPCMYRAQDPLYVRILPAGKMQGHVMGR